MNEELLIERKFGKPRPFNVPEGYFESFQTTFMTNLPSVPAQKGRTVLRRLRHVMWAASVAAVVVFAAVYLGGMFGTSNDRTVASVSSADMSLQMDNDIMIDELSDYAMMDNDDFYSFIADE